MKKFLAVAAIAVLPACTDPYGNPDPAGTALLGAAAGAAVGYGISQATVSQPAYYQPYGAPAYVARPAYRGRYYARRPPPPPPRYYGARHYQRSPYAYRSW